MVYDFYSFKDGEVQLEFKFARDEKNMENKKAFLKLMQQAIATISSEFVTTIPPSMTPMSDQGNKYASPFKPIK